MEHFTENDVTVIIPAVTLDRLTLRCLAVTSTLFPNAEMIVLADEMPPQDNPFFDYTLLAAGMTIAAKRNLAVSNTDRPLIAFIDSDAYPTETWLHAALTVFNSDNSYSLVAGPNVMPPNSPTGERLVGTAELSFLITINGNYIKKIAPNREVQVMPSCNMIMKKDSYLSIGGMRSDLEGGEDFEFCKRYTQAGYKMLYHNEAIVFHKCRNVIPFLKKRIAYGGFAFDNLRRSVTLPILLTNIPALFVLFVALMPLAYYFPALEYLYISVLTGFILVVIAEGIRVADGLRLSVLVIPLLFLGTVMPGIGGILRATCLLPKYRSFYKNFE